MTNIFFDWRSTVIWIPHTMSEHAASEIRLQRFMSGTTAIGNVRDFAEEHTPICDFCGENKHEGRCIYEYAED